MNKKGISTFRVMIALFVILISAILLGATVFIFSQINTALDRDVDIGQVNLRTLNNQTYGKFNTAMLNTADDIGIILVVGEIISVFLIAYASRKYPKIMIAADIVLIGVSVILAKELSDAYRMLITASSTLDVYVNTLPNTSRFVLNLPIITSIVGVVVMILSYINFKKPEEEVSVGGL